MTITTAIVGAALMASTWRRRQADAMRDLGPDAHPDLIARYQVALRAHATAELERVIQQEARESESLARAKPFLDKAQAKRDRRAAKRLALKGTGQA